MNKYLYKIKDLEVPPWLKYWFARKSKVNFDLSQILRGTSFNLENSVNKKLHLINIFGNSVQNGEPTPESSIDINSSGDNGSITEKFVNKNFIDLDYYEKGGIDPSTGQDIIQVFSARGENYIKVKPNTAYILSANTSCSNIRLAEYENDKTFIQRNQSTQLSSLLITTTANTGYLRWTINYNNTTQMTKEIAESLNLQLEENSISTDYELHQEQNFIIPCQQPMRAIGDVKDTFVKVNGVWYERHNINKIIFNGSDNENWVANETNTNTIRFVSASIIENDKALNRLASSMMNNTFKEYDGNAGIGNIDSEGIAIRDNFSGFTIRALISRVSNLDGFKLWLSTHNVIVNYVLKEPIDLPCTQAQITALENLQKARTYKNITHIYSDDEVPANLEIQYYKEKEEE